MWERVKCVASVWGCRVWDFLIFSRPKAGGGVYVYGVPTLRSAIGWDRIGPRVQSLRHTQQNAPLRGQTCGNRIARTKASRSTIMAHKSLTITKERKGSNEITLTCIKKAEKIP